MTEIEKKIRKDREQHDIVGTAKKLFAKYMKEFESQDRAVMAVSAITGLSANTVRKYNDL